MLAEVMYLLGCYDGSQTVLPKNGMQLEDCKKPGSRDPSVTKLYDPRAHNAETAARFSATY